MKSLSYSLVAIGLVFSSNAALAQTTAFERQLDHRNKNEWVTPAPAATAPRQANRIQLGESGIELIEFFYDIGASHVDETEVSANGIEITADFPTWHAVTERNGALFARIVMKANMTENGTQQSFKYSEPEIIFSATKPARVLTFHEVQTLALENGINIPDATDLLKEANEIESAISRYFRAHRLTQH